jgi:chemotaxis signal transduction protein
VLAAEEPIIVIRQGIARFAIPLRDVERIVSAAMPVSVPGASGAQGSVVRIGERLVPVVFARGLFDGGVPGLKAEDKLVLLRGSTPLALWVDAVEDLVPFVPLPDGAHPVPDSWASCFSGGDLTVAVLDVAKLFGAAKPPRSRSDG